MRKLTLIAAAVALGGASGMSLAADLGGLKDEPLAAPPIIRNWTGFFVGVGVGGGAVTHEFDLFVPPFAVNIDGFGADGAFGTVHGGFDWQFPLSRFVIGAFVDYDWTDISTDARIDIPVIPFNLASAALDVDNIWSVGGRLGYLATPDTLIYGLAGYTQMSTTGSFSLFNGFLFGSEDFTFDGWTVGAGIETRLVGNVYLKGEYRFSQFDDELLFAAGPNSATLTPDLHTVRAVLLYKFGSAEVAPIPLK